MKGYEVAVEIQDTYVFRGHIIGGGGESQDLFHHLNFLGVSTDVPLHPETLKTFYRTVCTAPRGTCPRLGSTPVGPKFGCCGGKVGVNVVIGGT